MVYKPCRTECSLSKPLLSTGIDTRPVSAPQAQDETHLDATSWPPGHARLRGGDPSRLERGGAHLQDHAAEGVGRDGAAGMEKAEVSDFHAALRENVLEEPTEKFHGIEGGGAWARTARFTVGEGDGAVFESHKTSSGDGAPEDIGGEVGEGGVTSGTGLRVAVPGQVPELGGDLRQQSGLSPVFFDEGSVEG